MAAHRVLGLTAERASSFRNYPRCNAAPSESRGFGSSSTVSGTSMSGGCSTTTMLLDHIPRCPCSWYVTQLHDRIVHVLEESMLEAGATTKGRDLRLEVRRIRSGASRVRPGDVAWLDFMAPHRHLVVYVTVKSARSSTNVPRISARFPLPGSLALGAQHGKLYADLRTSALLGTLSIQSVHENYPFAMEDGGRLALKAVDLVDRLPIRVAFAASLAWVVLTLALCVHTFMSVSTCRSSNYCSLSAFLVTCAARIHATSFCCSSWYFGFLSSRRIA
jgi:hypothetical protein